MHWKGFKAKQHGSALRIIIAEYASVMLGWDTLEMRRRQFRLRIKLTAKTVDEGPASCKRWISRKEIKSAKI